ncbi:hypothetical protein C6P45_000731 [Maudiozyma exigua]|uniref:Uncharacterized protein n=1 Tax=Maudiozyma exigua TaxID=34358 RepID=A0A9P7B808_MAUEX|nr:hypothetical protein C6P45_000731 [Kazachstania exigua]
MSALLIYDAQPNQIPRCYDNTTVRIMVMGDNCSGKTSFILRCLNGTYREIESGFYMEDIYRRPLNLPSLLSDSKLSNDHDIIEFIDSNSFDKKISPKEVQFLDASPFEIADFSELRNQQIIQSDAFILCFDPTNMESLLNLRTYQRRIERVRGIDDTVPVMIVATKSDLMAERKVSNEDVLEMKNRFELSYHENFMEISSKHDINVKKLFVKTLIKSEQYKYQQRNGYHESISDITELGTSSSDVDMVGPTDREHVSNDTNNSNNSNTNIIGKITPISNNTSDIEPVHSKVRLINVKSSTNGRIASNVNTNDNRGTLNKINSNSSRTIIVREKTAALDYKTPTSEKKKHDDSCCIIC